MKLTVGDKVPDFKVTTQNRKAFQIHDVIDKKTVFWVIRYIGCTVCRYDVHLLQEKYDEIADKGVNLFVVMQSDVEHVRNDLKEVKLPFEIICDPEQVIYETLEIKPAGSKEELAGDGLEKLRAKGTKAREAGFSHGDYEGNELQLPALFIVDEQARVIYSHYGKNIVDMPSVDELIELLGTL